MIKSPYIKDALVPKKLFLIETEPGSGKYSEVMFTEEQWDKLADLAESFFKKAEHEPGCNCKDKDTNIFVVPLSEAGQAYLPQFTGEFTQEEVDEAYRRVTDAEQE